MAMQDNEFTPFPPSRARFLMRGSYTCYEEFPKDMRPHVGDVLAFQTLSLNEETWTPELSPYRVAEVRFSRSSNK